MDPKEYWNMRAQTFSAMCGRNRYADEFIEKLALNEGEAVFDMGCATGSLAVPMAQRGHQVFACDFSPKMLENLQARMEGEGQLPIKPKLMAWQDDWDAVGFGPDSVDVAIASRSIPSGVDGSFLPQAIDKLDRIARRRVAITVAASTLPAREPRLLAHLGRAIPSGREDAEAIGILAAKGRYPELSYIICPRPMHFALLEAGVSELRRMAGEPLTQAEEAAFQTYAAQHFHAVERDGKEAFELDYPLMVHWAFIAWSTEG